MSQNPDPTVPPMVKPGEMAFGTNPNHEPIAVPGQVLVPPPSQSTAELSSEQQDAILAQINARAATMKAPVVAPDRAPVADDVFASIPPEERGAEVDLDAVISRCAKQDAQLMVRRVFSSVPTLFPPRSWNLDLFKSVSDATGLLLQNEEWVSRVVLDWLPKFHGTWSYERAVRAVVLVSVLHAFLTTLNTEEPVGV